MSAQETKTSFEHCAGSIENGVKNRLMQEDECRRSVLLLKRRA